MQAEANQPPVAAPIQLDIGTATFEDIKAALRAGIRDTLARPALSLFFGLVYAIFGLCLIAGLVIADQIWIAIAAGVGFPLVAPFLAAGLYEMSRRLKRGVAFSPGDIFSVIFRQQRREFSIMSFVILFVFWIWAYQVRIVLALNIHHQGYGSIGDLTTALFTTAGGLSFLAIGTVIGAVLATVLYAITVISMPLLLDKNVDFVTAMITSVKTVLASPAIMLGWGTVIGAVTLLAVVPAFVGVIFVFPVLGHTTWHLYERLVSEK